jgi:hypothetical protein
MRHSNPRRLRPQVQFLRRPFSQDAALPFNDVLPEDLVAQALTTASVSWVDRIFSPLVTPWVFLSQVLSAGHSCRVHALYARQPDRCLNSCRKARQRRNLMPFMACRVCYPTTPDAPDTDSDPESVLSGVVGSASGSLLDTP